MKVQSKIYKGYKVVGWEWIIPSDTKADVYITHPLWMRFLLLLDRIGIPLYYSPYVFDFPHWSFSPSQKEILKEMLPRYPKGSPSYHKFGHYVHTMAKSKRYGRGDKSILNQILFNHWSFWGQEGTISDKIRDPYPFPFRWKVWLDRLFKFRIEPIYEYE